MDMETLHKKKKLVICSYVSRNSVILAEYSDHDENDDGSNTDFSSMAAKCLEHVPDLHSRFGYTTSNRRFLCLIEGPFVYSTITDEALSKDEGFVFLEHVRDAFVGFLVQTPEVNPETLERHSFVNQMRPVFDNLVAPLVGIPQKEKDRIKAEEEEDDEDEDEQDEELVQIQRNGELHFGASSTSSGAVSSSDTEKHDCVPPSHSDPVESRSLSCAPFIGKKGKKKLDHEQTKTQTEIAADQHKKSHAAKEIAAEHHKEAADKDKHVEIMVGNNSPKRDESRSQIPRLEAAKKAWWQNFGIVIILDIVICLILLAVWLAVCKGVECIKRK